MGLRSVWIPRYPKTELSLRLPTNAVLIPRPGRFTTWSLRTTACLDGERRCSLCGATCVVQLSSMHLYRPFQFGWHPDMNRAKLTKHGIDFALAALVFADPHVRLREDRIDETGERHWHALGLAGGLEPFLLEVPVYREASDGEEIVRIISARKARKSERRAYFQ